VCLRRDIAAIWLLVFIRIRKDPLSLLGVEAGSLAIKFLVVFLFSWCENRSRTLNYVTSASFYIIWSSLLENHHGNSSYYILCYWQLRDLNDE
jgi:hypothetical protein